MGPSSCKGTLTFSGRIQERDKFMWESTDVALASIWGLTAQNGFTVPMKVTYQKIRK